MENTKATHGSQGEINAAAGRGWRRGSITAGATLLALSVGLPNACMDMNPNDVAQKGSGTNADPMILTRDNIAVGGELPIEGAGVSATVSSPFLSDGKWKGVTGHIRIYESRKYSWGYNDQYTPILPRANFTSPGMAKFGTRAGTMVHGNLYEVSVVADDNLGDRFYSSKVVKLSEDTLVVPVVTISWKRPGADPSFVNEFYPSLSMFDFNPIYINYAAAAPYWLPDNTKITPLPLQVTVPLLQKDIDVPNPYFFAGMPPDKEEIPPDDIWEKCGIQFQVVEQLIADLPAGWQNHCNSNALNFPNPEGETYKQMASTPAARDYLVNDLKPIYVSYGDLSLCTSGFGNSFYASTPGKGRFIESNYQRPRNTTAHELGHSLGLDHAYDANNQPLNDNLMRANGPGSERALNPAQCAAARVKAKYLSDRYDYYNRVTGRTYSATVPPPPSGSGGGDQGGGGFDPGGGGQQVCCKGGGDVHYGAAGSCSGQEVAVDKCEQVCCSNGKKETRFLCEAQGASGSACAPH